MRNISFALTTEQHNELAKDVTRRDGWKFLKPEGGELIQGVEKSRGLKAGEQIQRLHVIKTITVRRERLDQITLDADYGRRECIREGFPEMKPSEFIEMFCDGHKGVYPHSLITRIEFGYWVNDSLIIPVFDMETGKLASEALV